MADTQPDPKILPSSASAAAYIGSSSSTFAVPTAIPPSEGGSASLSASDVAAALGTVWVNGKKVNALWAINENRNSWISIAGVGWVKLANNSDTAITALTMLGANARQTQGVVNFRQENDNMIHEIYVW